MSYPHQNCCNLLTSYQAIVDSGNYITANMTADCTSLNMRLLQII